MVLRVASDWVRAVQVPWVGVGAVWCTHWKHHSSQASDCTFVCAVDINMNCTNIIASHDSRARVSVGW
jgi:hypothetical protein